jgi:hypothetical protein
MTIHTKRKNTNGLENLILYNDGKEYYYLDLFVNKLGNIICFEPKIILFSEDVAQDTPTHWATDEKS